MRPGYCDKDGVSLFIEEDLSKVADRMGLKHVTDSVALSSLKFVDAYDRNVIPANDLFRSDFMRINLDFANGQSTIVTLPLQDPEFKKFVDKCMPAPTHNSPVTYSGTLDGFAAALPGFLDRTAAAIGLPPQPFDSQIATIIERVRTCASITPQMVAAHTGLVYINFDGMGAPYKYCDSQLNTGWPILPRLKTQNPELTRGLYMGISPRGTWGDGRGLRLTIIFDDGVTSPTTGGDGGIPLAGSNVGVVRAEIENLTPQAIAQTAQVPQPVVPIHNPDLPSTTEVWKGFTMAHTKRLVRDPNPQAPANCTIPANSEVEVKAGGPDSSGRITVSTIGQPAYKAAPCSYLFYTTSDNLRK